MIPPSYATEYAAPTRASRVAVTAARYRHIERLSLAGPHTLQGRPFMISVDPDGIRIAVRYDDRTVVLVPYGSKQFHPDPYWVVTLTEDAYIQGPQIHPWDGSPRILLRPLGVFDDPGTQVVGWLRQWIWTAVVQHDPVWGSTSLRVKVRPNGPREDDPEAPRWNWKREGYGTAAIDPSGRVFVAMSGGDCAVLGPTPVADTRTPRIVGEDRLGVSPYAVSAVETGFAVLCADDLVDASRHPNDRIARIHERGAPKTSLLWDTVIVHFDATGHQTWRVTVPVQGRQPAIDLGAGRIAIVGNGTAVVDGGRVVWSRPSRAPCFATALEHGRLAISDGSVLRIVDPDGRDEQTLEMPDGAVIVTPPAPGPDATIYLGTVEHVLAIR